MDDDYIDDYNPEDFADSLDDYDDVDADIDDYWDETEDYLDEVDDDLLHEPSLSHDRGHDHLSMPGLSDVVLTYLLRGDKLLAVKAYRDETGCSLKEAKEYVDYVERTAVPERKQPDISHASDNYNKGSLGCLTGLFIVLALAVAYLAPL